MRTLNPDDVDHIIIHCTAGKDDATLEEIRDYHVNVRGFSSIGYHFLVWPDGTVKAGRPIWNVGAHASTGGFNNRSLAVAFVGLYDEYAPTPEAMSALIELVHTLCFTYKIKASSVLGHREVYDKVGQRRLKTYPGLAVDMDALRASVASLAAR